MWRVWVCTVLVFQQAMWPVWMGCQKKSIAHKSGLPFYSVLNRANMYPFCMFTAVFLCK